MKKTKALAGIVAAVLLIGGVSVFATQKEEEKKPSPRQRIELTEEQKAKMKEEAKERLAKQLEEGKITEEQYNELLQKIENGEFNFRGKGRGKGFGKGNFQKKELTEEQKAEMKEEAKERLAKQLEEGKITEEQYNELLQKIESGEFNFRGRGPREGKGFPRKNCFRTEKQNKNKEEDTATE